METSNVKLPDFNVDVMITYEKTINFGAYGIKKRKEVVTKRGLYSKLFNNFTIPPEYRMFNGILLPHGFGGDRLPANKVIRWEYCKE